jgi:hypothetical protein
MTVLQDQSCFAVANLDMPEEELQPHLDKALRLNSVFHRNEKAAPRRRGLEEREQVSRAAPCGSRPTSPAARCQQEQAGGLGHGGTECEVRSKVSRPRKTLFNRPSHTYPPNHSLEEPATLLLVRFRSCEKKSFANSGRALPFAFRNRFNFFLQVRVYSETQARIFSHPENLSTLPSQ